MNDSSQKQLKRFIDEVSFAMGDVILFLDTHPCDEEALKCYEEYRKMREEAMEEYTKNYGPLLNDHVPPADKWKWALQPWPWKGGC